MELVELYNKAIWLVEEVKKFSPQIAESEDISLCVIVSGNEKIYAGVTGLRISDDTIKKSCSEYNALMSMIAEGQTIVKQMMTVAFYDGSVSLPCSECIDMLYKADENNTQCEIAVSVENSIKACELSNAEVYEDTSETSSMIEEAPAFSEEPISDSFSFEEKFGFDFDDEPAAPVPTLADQNAEPQTVQQHYVNPYPEQQYQNIASQGINPQFIQPNNVQGYTQSQGYPYPPQGYPQQSYPQQNGINPQFVQPDMQQGYSQQNYQPYGQPVTPSVNQGNFSSNAQPYSQNPSVNQPLQSVYPHQPAPYTSSRYINSSVGSSSQPIGSVPLSGEGKSKFRQRLSKFMNDDTPVSSSAPVSKPAEESLSKDELKKLARDKKKMAKVNADFKKRMKDLGY